MEYKLRNIKKGILGNSGNLPPAGDQIAMAVGGWAVAAIMVEKYLTDLEG